MKPGAFTLNPYAASYIPLSKREAADKIEISGVTVKASQSGYQTGWCGPAEYTAKTSQHDKASSLPEVSRVKSQVAHGSSSQNPKEMTEKQMMDDEFDMDLEYLRMTFPGISDESLTDVYMANNGDLDATVDMLTQLELDTLESSENLPDTLDIGDVSECGTSAERSAVNLMNVVGEASASSSGPLASDSVVVT